MSAIVEVVGLRTIEIPWNSGVTEVAVGKDVLELLSSSMYVDPMSVYREYVQNAADAIDEAKENGLIAGGSAGRVEVSFDIPNRGLRIRDNGAGVRKADFEHRMASFGGSKKRGTKARGFRGVGRLAGIGYCQELVFRTRAAGESRISELRWDCRKIKTLLRTAEFQSDLIDLVKQVVTWRQIEGKGLPEHFFEVELRGIVRQGNDLLLDPNAIAQYLSQTAPLAFSPTFARGKQIIEMLEPHDVLGSINLQVEGIGQVYRPHQNKFEIKESVSDSFSTAELVQIPSVDGGLAAIGWILHHDYKGAIPADANVRGLRFRVGNIQVGNETLLEDIFLEPRFNAWSVGEIHILDSRVVPNGRRDHFEQNVHYLNILNHLGPVTRDLSQRCRSSSAKRNWLRRFELHKHTILEIFATLKQGSLSRPRRDVLHSEIEAILVEMEKIAEKELVRDQSNRVLAPTLRNLRKRLQQSKGRSQYNRSLGRLSRSQQTICETVFSLIYDYSNDAVQARKLIDKILSRLDKPLKSSRT